MSKASSPSRRFLRAGAILLIGWIALEIALAQLLAARIGWGALILLMTIKGGAGLLLVGVAMIAGLRNIAAAARDGAGLPTIQAAGFTVASAVLLVLPGIAPTFLAGALFAPSLRAWLVALWHKRHQEPDPREIDLSATEWREVGSKKPARRVPRKATTTKNQSS